MTRGEVSTGEATEATAEAAGLLAQAEVWALPAWIAPSRPHVHEDLGDGTCRCAAVRLHLHRCGVCQITYADACRQPCPITARCSDHQGEPGPAPSGQNRLYPTPGPSRQRLHAGDRLRVDADGTLRVLADPVLLGSDPTMGGE